MPFTPLHCVMVWPLYIRCPKRFDFIALTVGAMIPDVLEPDVILLIPQRYWSVRGLTHSLLGAVTLDLLLGLLVGYYIFPYLVQFFMKRSDDVRWYTFAGHNILKRKKHTIIVYSTLIGTVSHVLLDVPFHTTSPLFWPLGSVSVSYRAEWYTLPLLPFNLLFLCTFALLVWKFWAAISPKQHSTPS